MATLETINKQRTKAPTTVTLQNGKQVTGTSAAPIATTTVLKPSTTSTTPIGTTQRSAEQNAALQQQAHKQQLDTLQATGQTVNQQAKAGDAPIASEVRAEQQPYAGTMELTPTEKILAGEKQRLEARRTDNATQRYTERAADAAEKNLTTKNPNATPQEIADARAAAAAEEASNAQRDAANAASAASKPPVTEAAPIATTGTTATPPTTPTATPTTPEASGANAAFANLPPEAQQLSGAIADLQKTVNESLAGSTKLTADTMKNIETTFGDIQTRLDTMEAGARTDKNAIQSLLDSIKEETEQSLAEQQKSEQERLSWAQLDARRAAVKQKAEAHDSMIAQIALAGGFGQDAGLAAVMESDAQFDGKIADIAIEYGYARNDLAAKYSALYIENKNKYIDATIGNMKELRGALERIGMQGISNATARQAAEQKALEAGWTNQTNLRTTLATQNLDVAKEIGKMVQDERIFKYQQKQDDWNKSWEQFKYEQDNLYRYDALAASQSGREEALITKRDDKERYNAQLVMDKIRGGMEGNMVFDQFKQARTSWESLKTAYEAKDNPFKDRAMAKSYEKLVEVGSVVMPGEYADITSNVPLLSKIQGKLEKVANGGQAWTDAERTAIKDLSENLFKAYEARRNEEAQIFNATIQFHNQNTENPDYMLSPSMFNLPEQTSSVDREKFQNLLPSGYQSPFGNPNAPQIEDNGDGLQSFKLGTMKITGKPQLVSALTMADQAFFADTGRHLEINSSYRSAEQQKNAYERYQRGEIALAAKPGTSFHEKGMAVDVTNWKEAEPYLVAAGIYPMPKKYRSKDPAHFSIGESPLS